MNNPETNRPDVPLVAQFMALEARTASLEARQSLLIRAYITLLQDLQLANDEIDHLKRDLIAAKVA